MTFLVFTVAVFFLLCLVRETLAVLDTLFSANDDPGQPGIGSESGFFFRSLSFFLLLFGGRGLSERDGEL